VTDIAIICLFWWWFSQVCKRNNAIFTYKVGSTTRGNKIRM